MGTQRRKLLLADDSATIQKVVSLTFSDEGVEVVCVGDGEQALRHLEAGSLPDIVLADVVMPGLNGYQLCERIKRDTRFRRIPVVLLVSTFEPFQEAEARRVGADDVLTKPFQSIRGLVSKVGSLLSGSESKPETPEQSSPPAQERPEPRSEATPAPRASDATSVAASVEREARDERRAAFVDEPAATFNDLDFDDQMIEATPAEEYVESAGHSSPHASPNVSQAAHDASSDLSLDAADAMNRSEATERNALDAWAAGGERSDYAAEPHMGDESDALPDDAFRSQEFVADSQRVLAVQAETDESEPVFHPAPAAASNLFEPPAMFEPSASSASSAQTASTQAASTQTASPLSAAPESVATDDMLLDLDGDEASPSVGAADSDDFILDLEDDAPQPSVAAAQGDVFDWDAPEVVEIAPATIDAASGFAEAAHGEPEAYASRDFSFAASEAEPLHHETFDAESPLSADIFAVDEPEPFNAGSPQASESVWSETNWTQTESASWAEPEPVQVREFIEPTVVPAHEPVPAVFEDEYTDGSVEGDLAKPPAAAQSGQGVAATRDAEVYAAPEVMDESEAVVNSSTSIGSSTAIGSSTEERAGSAQPATQAATEAATEAATSATGAGELSPQTIDAIARRVVELLSDRVVREIAWEVVPQLSELLIRQRLDEEKK